MDENITLEKLIEIVSQEKRERIDLRLSKTILKLLKKIIEEEEIIEEDGKPYSIRHFIEDMVIWVLGSEKRLQQFLDDMYEVIEEDEEEESEDEKETE